VITSIEELQSELKMDPDWTPNWLPADRREDLLAGTMSQDERDKWLTAWSREQVLANGPPEAGYLWHYRWPDGETLAVMQSLSFDGTGDYQVVGVEYARSPDELLGPRSGDGLYRVLHQEDPQSDNRSV
jgi:hypothetical protein